MRSTLQKLDTRIAGILIGILFPLIVILVIWQTQMGDRTLGQFFRFLGSRSSLQNNILIMLVIPNMFVFYFTNFRWKMDKFTTGLVGTTIFLALVVAILIML